ncbi:MAG: TetR/AcrR family transcriptional regulator [Lachnospiraceae bacterium]|nr:TetR/AcrR family transcriptional regulator [Lachnospiraceae bacterium]
MPRDKTQTHQRVLEAAKYEFLEKGFEKTSIRDIAKRAGITSPGLYRHCKDKEDLFCKVVEPGIHALSKWMNQHIKTSYEQVENHSFSGIHMQSEIEMMREAVIPYAEEFVLLLNCSGGTKYENFLHDMVKDHEEKFWQALQVIKDSGYKVKDVSREELHIIISAYMTALFEPIVHGYERNQIEHYLDTVEEFFMPGWKGILGI